MIDGCDMAAGGDGLAALTQGTSVKDTGTKHDAVASCLKKHPVVSAATDRRVTNRVR